MSSVTIAASPLLHHAAPVRTRLRATARGRRVLSALMAVPAIVVVTVVLCAAVFAGGSALASDDGGAPSGSFASVTVQSGDSLWSIASDVAPTADPRDVVDGIVRLNALEGGAIHPGQQLALPLEYAP
ncbi:MAG: LysM peptidoglycan-binding domain-containing protein [Microbacterium sp.]|uniref:LysM peptidoglycan-binding domain-containing protein n=1 Tax=Microbacterium sp. TaxID=51671 RepID=UPI003A85CA8D